MAKKKRLSLADRILAKNSVNTPKEEKIKEQDILSVVTSPENDPNLTHQNIEINIKPNNRVRSGSGQGQVDTVSPQGQLSVDTVSTKGQVGVNSLSGQGQVSSIRSGSSQGQVSGIRSGSGQGQVDTVKNTILKESDECILAEKQQIIYIWFLKHGISGYFNKGQIQRETGINHPTVRKSIAKLQVLNILQVFEYDPVSRQQKYIINTDKKIHLLKGSGQGQVSSIRPGSGQGQVSSIRTA